jgi:hypothetical protein
MAKPHKVFILCFNPERAKYYQALCEGIGLVYSSEIQDGGKAYYWVKENLPILIIADIEAKISHVKQTLISLDKTKATAQIPTIFVASDPSNFDAFAKQFPHSRFFLEKDMDSALLLEIVEYLQYEK